MSQPHVRYKVCGCGEWIMLVPTEATGKLMPLDSAPNDRGNVVVYQEGDGRWVAHVLRKDTPPPIGTLMMPHFATCKLRVER